MKVNLGSGYTEEQERRVAQARGLTLSRDQAERGIPYTVEEAELAAGQTGGIDPYHASLIRFLISRVRELEGARQ